MEKKTAPAAQIKPMEAKIVGVTTLHREGLHSDSVLCGFEFEGKKIAREFISPFMNDKNIKLWRKLTLAVLTGKKPAGIVDASLEFAKYKEAVSGQTVAIAYDDEEEAVFGIGHSAENMFFPEAYGLWDEAQ
jgi:hypothetical protein